MNAQALIDLLEESRRAGRKLLVPYLVAGIPDRSSYPEALSALESIADAIEVGLPFSDPLMDGPVIAAAAERAIANGVGPIGALDLSAQVPPKVPRCAMTYFNPIHRVGLDEFCRRAVSAGFAGLIVPDLPVEESDGLQDAAKAAGLAWIPLVAPTSPPERVKAIVAGATGFVYAVSTLGVTGTRETLSERAERVVTACRAATDLPVLVGIGISTPSHAVEAARYADGVVIGSAVVGRLADSGIAAASTFLQDVRSALDGL